MDPRDQRRVQRVDRASLHVSPATVKKHLDNIYAKLGVRGRAASPPSSSTSLDRDRIVADSRPPDDPDIATEWEPVGTYRRWNLGVRPNGVLPNGHSTVKIARTSTEDPGKQD